MKDNTPKRTVSVLGIGLAKQSFQLHGVDTQGNVVLKKKPNRKQLLPFVAQLPACIVGLEACGGENYWARALKALGGHQMHMMVPQFVKPYVKSNKNDATDAEAICEAVQRPSMRFVPTKSIG